MKTFLRSLFFLLLSYSRLAAQDSYDPLNITGFWKSIDDVTGRPRCVVAIYEHERLYYGRIICTFDDEGKIKDSIEHPHQRAPGVVGTPYYCGLDIIWHLYNRGLKYKGKILDPEKGNVYNAEVWRNNEDLVVRGKLMMFGRNQIWLPAVKSDFPAHFKLPDIKKFVPDIPEPN
jgi:uncharacterized protein (DUF2147 family)